MYPWERGFAAESAGRARVYQRGQEKGQLQGLQGLREHPVFRGMQAE